MFRYLNHRFHWKNFSFQIPDGFYLDCMPEMEADNFLWLWFFDEKHSLTRHVAEDCADTKTELEAVITDIAPEWASPVKPIMLNGLCGHYTEYHLSYSRYHEAWLQLDGNAAFNIVISGSTEFSNAEIAAVFAAVDPRMEQEV